MCVRSPGPLAKITNWQRCAWSFSQCSSCSDKLASMARRCFIDGLRDAELEMIFGKVDFAERYAPSRPPPATQRPFLTPSSAL